MKWKGRQGSSNVEDRRGKRVSNSKKVGGGIGVAGIIFAIVYSLVTGQDPSVMLQDNSIQQNNTTQYEPGTAADNEELAQFSKVVLKDTEDVWFKLFREQLGREYVAPKMVIFNGETTGTCGYAGTTTGPYYCPADQTIYLDLNFLKDMGKKYGAAGDFAAAYVISHEVGHHIQYLTGILQKVQQEKQRLSKKEGNKLSVKLELQADFLAGMWAHHAHKMKNILEKGDVEEGMRAAASVGDDRLQMQAHGYTVPDAFTHGTSAQRTEWFMKGFKTGNFDYGDTFSAI